MALSATFVCSLFIRKTGVIMNQLWCLFCRTWRVYQKRFLLFSQCLSVITAFCRGFGFGFIGRLKHIGFREEWRFCFYLEVISMVIMLSTWDRGFDIYCCHERCYQGPTYSEGLPPHVFLTLHKISLFSLSIITVKLRILYIFLCLAFLY